MARSDVKGYFASISHKHLIAQLNKRIHDHRIMDLLSPFITRYIDKDGWVVTHHKGIAFGSPLSNLFGTLYLASLDACFYQRQGVWYMRYMDDWIILIDVTVHPDKTSVGRTTNVVGCVGG